MTSGSAQPPRGQAALPGLTADPVPADGQRLLPGLAELAGAQHVASALGGLAGASQHPMADADPELGRVAAELLAIDPDGSRIGSAVRGALDLLLDGQHTGRYRWDHLCKTETLVPNLATGDDNSGIALWHVSRR